MSDWRYTPQQVHGDEVEYDPFPYAGTSSYVPAGYEMDPWEHNCLGHAEQLADADDTLIYCEGYTRKAGATGQWGSHAWCETADGVIVDPYAEWAWPGETLDYRKAADGEDVWC